MPAFLKKLSDWCLWQLLKVSKIHMKKLPKSIRKYIRREKALIRREVLDLVEQKRLINELYQRFLPKTKVSDKIEHYDPSINSGSR